MSRAGDNRGELELPSGALQRTELGINCHCWRDIDKNSKNKIKIALFLHSSLPLVPLLRELKINTNRQRFGKCDLQMSSLSLLMESASVGLKRRENRLIGRDTF